MEQRISDYFVQHLVKDPPPQVRFSLSIVCDLAELRGMGVVVLRGGGCGLVLCVRVLGWSGASRPCKCDIMRMVRTNDTHIFVVFSSVRQPGVIPKRRTVSVSVVFISCRHHERGSTCACTARSPTLSL